MANNTYLQTVINQIGVAEPDYTPAQKVVVNQFNNDLTNSVNNGLDPVTILRMTAIISILYNKGLTVDQLQTHHLLIARMGFDSDFDTSDNNIDRIYERIIHA